MNQLFTVPNKRRRTMNVPCTGKFDIMVEDGGFWNVDVIVDGVTFYCSRGSMIPAGDFRSIRTGETLSIPDWMWDSICATMDELKLELERDALDTPQLKETWV